MLPTTPPKFEESPKNGGRKTILSYWVQEAFQGWRAKLPGGTFYPFTRPQQKKQRVLGDAGKKHVHHWKDWPACYLLLSSYNKNLACLTIIRDDREPSIHGLHMFTYPPQN